MLEDENMLGGLLANDVVHGRCLLCLHHRKVFNLKDRLLKILDRRPQLCGHAQGQRAKCCLAWRNHREFVSQSALPQHLLAEVTGNQMRHIYTTVDR